MQASKREPAAPIILLIEDEPSAREALALILEDWGATVIAGASEDELARAINGRWPEVRYIVTDFDLGERVNGVTLVQHLTRKAPQAHVLVLSGFLGADAKRAANRAGYAFMSKPARANDIINWLENA